MTNEEILSEYLKLKESFNKFEEMMSNQNFDIRGFSKASPVNIVNLVKREFNTDITAKNRLKNTIYGRQAAAYLLKKYTALSLKEIALMVGVTDHTTTLYSIRRCQDILDTEDWYLEKVSRIINEIESIK